MNAEPAFRKILCIFAVPAPHTKSAAVPPAPALLRIRESPALPIDIFSAG